MALEAFCDDLNEHNWFTTLDPRLKPARFHRIGQRGRNPDVIDDLISYDRPDVILLKDGIPILTIEKTREVPTGHNVGQRVARLVRSLELGIPAIKFFPFDARKHGAYSNMCNLNARLLLAFESMWKIHSTPMIAVNWPADQYGELFEDDSADSSMRSLLSGFIDSGFNPNCQSFLHARQLQLAEYQKRCNNYEAYHLPPPSLEIVRTAEVLNRLNLSTNSSFGKKLIRHNESVIYKIEMNEEKCRREDPYTGTQFIYDYLYCRNGPLPENKFRNLILYFPKIREEIWSANNPNDNSRKSSNWYLTASAHVYKDGTALFR